MDVERIAGGDPVELLGIDPGIARETLDTGPAERFERQLAKDGQRGHAAEDPGDARFPAVAVPMGDEQQYRTRLDPSGKEGQEIERGLIGPLDVFDDQDPHRPDRHPLQQPATELAS